MKLKEIVTTDKPREKLKNLGVENLTNTELLSILLRTGSKSESVNELSNRVLKETETLNKLKNATLSRLTSIKGIKNAKACTILAAFELGKRAYSEPINKRKINTPDKIFNYYKNTFKGTSQEKLFVLLYDTKLNLIKTCEIYKGGISNCLAHPREIFKVAIEESAVSIIIMHNHPSEDITPSKTDIELTERLIKVGEIIGIEVIDHIIICSDDYFSFKEFSINRKNKHKIN